MKKFFKFSIVLLLSLAASCGVKTDSKNDEAALRKWIEDYVANNNSGDFENYGSSWTEDAIWLPPGVPVVTGKTAIMEFAEPFYTQYKIDQKLTIEEISTVGDLAYIRVAGNEVYSPNTADADTIRIQNKGIFLLRRESGGSWIGTHCVWNYNSPSAQAISLDQISYENEKKAIIELCESWGQFKTADEYFNHITDDFIMLAPGLEPLSDPDSIYRWIETISKNSIFSFPDLITDEILVFDTIAIHRYRGTAHFTSKKDSSLSKQYRKYIDILKKTNKGWKVSRHMFNRNN